MLAGALLGAAGVALGAFGAHGLPGLADAGRRAIWDTAVLYHLVHALAVVLVAALGAGASGAADFEAVERSGAAARQLAGWAFVTGIVLFSGSLYLLALGGPSLLGPVTPLGGVAFIVGWLSLAWSARAQPR